MLPGTIPALGLSAAGGAAGYQIARSLRFRSNAILTRTMGAPTSANIFTLSLWVKRGNLNVRQTILTGRAGGSNYGTGLVFGQTGGGTGDKIDVWWNSTINPILETASSYRDPAAWAHLLWSVNATAVTVYWNGVSALTGSVSGSPAFNTNGAILSFGDDGTGLGTLVATVAEVFFVDGQALTPSTFTQANATTGVLDPKAVTGLTYGNNGFHLDFSDNSAATAAALGKDSSGKGNNWTPSGISVTAGVTNDSLVDSPTSYGVGNLGGDVRGNYATVNPLNVVSAAYRTISDANLRVLFPSTTTSGAALSTVSMSSGKWYWEVTLTTGPAPYFPWVGIGTIDNIGFAADPGLYAIGSDGSKVLGGVYQASGGFSFDINDTVGVEFDRDNLIMRFYKNGVLQSGATISGIPANTYFASAIAYQSTGIVYNFGQRPFVNTAVAAGFNALCTRNMAIAPTPALPATFTGNGAADGPFVWAAGVVNTVTINGNVATRGTHFDGLSNGIKLRTASASYNVSGSNTITAATYGASIKYARGQSNP